MRVVLANGCFDLLHPGHVEHLKAARAMGDRLVVALTLDDYVDKGPGRPIYTWEQRAWMLRELRCVDQVIPSRNSAEAIQEVKPALFVKGIDYSAGLPFVDLRACEQIGAAIRFTDTPKMSATELIRKLRA
ncbi:MAG: adenylyltransferase/cytidyltransferase family protein [Burkholderiales bacterium]